MIKNLKIKIFLYSLSLIIISCSINPPDYDYGFDFIENISNANHESGMIMTGRFQVTEETRRVIITVPVSSPPENAKVTFFIPSENRGTKLYFGVGMNAEIGDGATGIITIATKGQLDTLYKRYINSVSNMNDRVWFDELIDISKYQGKNFFLSLIANPGPGGDYSADWFAWSTPIISKTIK